MAQNITKNMSRQKAIYLILSVAIISFLLNLFWEVSHSLLYDWNRAPLVNSVYFYVPKILYAALGDVMYILIIFFAISLFRKRISWVYQPERADYLWLSFFGAAVAVFVEIKADILNLWSYNPYMPQVLGIGITPLIQLAITSMLTIFIISRLVKSTY